MTKITGWKNENSLTAESCAFLERESITPKGLHLSGRNFGVGSTWTLLGLPNRIAQKLKYLLRFWDEFSHKSVSAVLKSELHDNLDDR